ncbi:MFS general substrate transporter [Coprinellus micaceus]|uniref:MFS general substrate transporter n=1 Tax=Coprinellus micaceus TaxID=71717 RepID=A0A4Y7SB49_COPMI|nr:MFS general substrate transporter [Coprinellus micaceus]
MNQSNTESFRRLFDGDRNGHTTTKYYTLGLDESSRDDELGDAEGRQKISPAEAQEAERNLVRKLDWRILPVTCLLYLFAYLDRSNLGNARLQGLPEDVLGGDPTGKKFDWIVSVFYISYIVCQIPAVIASKLFPPRVVQLTPIYIYINSCRASAVNFAGLVVCRLAIGVFEAGFGPAIPLYFCEGWHTGLASLQWQELFGGLIAFGVQHLDVSVARWKLLFIVEGLPSFLIGIAALWVLPNRPESTSIFNERERKIALERMNRSTRADVGLTVNRGDLATIYVCGVIYFGLNTALASISAFLPTIIATFGHSNAISQLLTVPPYASAAVVLILFARTSDIKQSRGVFMAIACVISGYCCYRTTLRSRYFATFCITSGTYTTIGLTIAWSTGIPMFMAIGQCGSILGSHIFPKSEGPNYTKGFAGTPSLFFSQPSSDEYASFPCNLSTHSNALKEAKYGKVDPDAPAPNFRYVP